MSATRPGRQTVSEDPCWDTELPRTFKPLQEHFSSSPPTTWFCSGFLPQEFWHRPTSKHEEKKRTICPFKHHLKSVNVMFDHRKQLKSRRKPEEVNCGSGYQEQQMSDVSALRKTPLGLGTSHPIPSAVCLLICRSKTWRRRLI